MMQILTEWKKLYPHIFDLVLLQSGIKNIYLKLQLKKY